MRRTQANRSQDKETGRQFVKRTPPHHVKHHPKTLMTPLGVPYAQTLEILTLWPNPGASMMRSPPM